MSLPVHDPEMYEFSETSFIHLMQKRIRKVLLICSSYDAFMLEEDGRIDEQIFNEYASYNLRYPPVFIQTDSASEASRIMQEEKIDLVIEMLNIKDSDSFQLAKKIKHQYADIPIVILTHFSLEVSHKLENEDLSAIDYVFSWLGNSDLLLAIIKLIEDKMNAEDDVMNVGVQVILLVEDSIRYISSYLPNLYKIIYTQSREFMKEGLNEHQKMLRMRGRPKILLATNYEDARNTYKKYKDNILGVISDVSYKKNTLERDTKAKRGLQLCRYIRKFDSYLPILLQSSEIENQKFAKNLNAGFLHKYSKNLSIELREHIRKYFAFGDFIFRDPHTNEQYARAEDLKALQRLILEVPNHILEYHTLKNDLSRWLYARALFPLARMLRNIHNEDFENLFNVRNYIFKAIESFRRYKSRGVIAQFDPERFDEYLLFSRIGNGSIGGKARGLAFISMLIKKYQLHNKYKDTAVSIPRTVVLSTEIFEEFMEKNSLYNIALSSVDDQTILDHFIEAHMPQTISNDLYTLLRSMNKPIAVRSSSKLEDSLFQPFAGVYSTYMIPVNHNNIPHSVGQLEHAIKCVYASAFFKTSKSYIEATANVIDEEKMGIIIQEICGSEHDGIYYPTFSGVAHSINFYPIEPEKAEEGIASIAYGLGKYIVEGGLSLRFSPVHPQRSIQLSSTESALKNTQKHFFGLSLSPDSFSPSVSDDINLRKFRLRKLPADKSLKYVLSTYDLENQILRDGITSNGSRVITFANILKNKAFPIPEILNDLLRIGQTEMNNPIEIEFAVEIHEDQEHPCTFNLLQIRPVVKNTHVKVPDLHSITHNEMIISSDKALGNIHDKTITDIIYVKPESFEPAHSKEIAYRIAELNEIFVDENRYYILIGPGRWGSADPWLGIPVKWTQISHARLIIESGLKNYDIDPSQGTHFFHNLTSFGVGYFTLNPFKNKGFYNIKYLNDKLSLIEDNYIRHVRLNNPVEIMIDGKHGRGVVLKPFEER